VVGGNKRAECRQRNCGDQQGDPGTTVFEQLGRPWSECVVDDRRVELETRGMGRQQLQNKRKLRTLPDVGELDDLLMPFRVQHDRARSTQPLRARLPEIDAREIMKRELRNRPIATPDDGTKVGEMVALAQPDRSIEPPGPTRPEQTFPRKREVFLSNGRCGFASPSPSKARESKEASPVRHPGTPPTVRYRSCSDKLCNRSSDSCTRVWRLVALPPIRGRNMIWVFERAREQLRCEIRRETSGPGFELIVTNPDGSQRMERFGETAALIKRSLDLQMELIEAGWRAPASKCAES
jgi:uncharacterized protein YlaI